MDNLYYCMYKCFECFTMRIKPIDDLSDNEEQDYYDQHINRD